VSRTAEDGSSRDGRFKRFRPCRSPIVYRGRCNGARYGPHRAELDLAIAELGASAIGIRGGIAQFLPTWIAYFSRSKTLTLGLGR
jgi:hypothetical protein